MERFVRGFIRAALAWFLVGGLLGLGLVFLDRSAVRPLAPSRS